MAPGASETAIEDRREKGDGRDEGVTSTREGVYHAAEAKIGPLSHVSPSGPSPSLDDTNWPRMRSNPQSTDFSTGNL